MQEKLAEKIIDAQAADKLIAAHDGDVALLYLYASRRGGLDIEQAARDLCRTLREVQAAEEKLRRMDLLTGRETPPAVPPPNAAETAVPPAPAEELPQYSAAEIARRSKADGTFAVLLDEAAKVIGRALNSNDIRVLFGIYDYLALPPEVIVELLNYCAELCREQYGSVRRPSARYIEKEAYLWANREIMTLEQAEEYIRAQKERRSELGRLKAALGIRGRELTATEARYLSSWLDMGFAEEAIGIAYDRTVTQTGGLKWPYMNKILLSWHQNGLHEPREIEAKDGRRGRKVSPATPAEEKPIDLDELRKILDKI